MHLELNEEALLRLISRQIDALFLLDEREGKVLGTKISGALERAERCFSAINNKYFRNAEGVIFSPYQTTQHMIFLYFLSCEMAPADSRLADKIYALNKALHGIDLFHQTSLPNVFFGDHPVGTVIGRAQFGERFYFSQGCTIGNNRGKFPVLGNDVYLMAGAKIIGSCNVGERVIVAANACIIDTDVPSNSIVFGQSPNLTFRQAGQVHFDRLNFFL